MSAPRTVLITNPFAARATADAARVAIDVLRRAGWGVDVVPTTGPGDARRLGEAAVREGVDVLVVQGGDGTMMQAAAALVGTPIPLGMLPAGTGNLLARNLRIPRSPRAAARVLIQGVLRRIDLGRVERAQGPVYFGVAAGTGVDARVMGETAAIGKRRWGMAAYIATILRYLPKVRSVPYRLTVDGRTIDTLAAMILVANCGDVIPPWIRLGHGITPDDGQLDLITVRAEGAWQSVRAMWEAVRGLPGGGNGGSFIGYARGRVIKVECETPEPVEMDGDPDDATPFTAEVVPGAIAVLTPTGRRAR